LDEENDDPNKPKGHPYAADYPDCLKIVEQKVKPDRAKNKRKARRERWWQYGDYAVGLEKGITDKTRVLVKTQVSPTWAFQWINTGIVFDQRLVILIDSPFTLLQSTIHQIWATNFGSTLGKTTYNYTPSDCFETFPFPESTTNLETIGETYYNHRQTIMQTRQEGLTKTYNRFHDPAETSEDIIKLRQLHVEMDYAVAAAYGWDDLIPPAPHPPALSRTPLTKGGMGGLNHDFHETKQGLRYTISEPIRREILDRLLQLNFDRYAEEEQRGLHDKKKGKSKKKGKKTSGQGSLF
jgi:hypothetical protein